jgi:hypothetical protein
MNNTMTILLDRCFECGTIGPVDLHHVVPKSKGGTKMIPLCLSCHTKVHGDNMLNFRKLANESRKKIIEDFKEKGIPHNFGRKEGSVETIETLMNKPKTKDIIYLLSFEYNTLRGIAKMANCSTKTVLKIKNLIKQYPEYKFTNSLDLP